MDSIDEAEAIIARLRAVPPQHATEATVGAYRNALDLLEDAVGSKPWLEAQLSLGHHLLESPDGDHVKNVAAAQDAYRTVLENVDPTANLGEWAAGAGGLANALVEVRDRLTDLRARLAPGDEEARKVLGMLLEHPAFASKGAPYAAPDFWGPFILTGMAGSPAAVAMSTAGAQETAA